MTITYTFPGCWLHVNVRERFLQTVFPDGARLCSVPVRNKDYETAWRYGYGGNYHRLWREHDLLHHWVAAQFGHPYSPTIWAEAHPDHPDAIPRWARQQEEDFLTAVHRWINCDLWVPELWPLTQVHWDMAALRDEAKRVLRGEVLDLTPCSVAR